MKHLRRRALGAVITTAALLAGVALSGVGFARADDLTDQLKRVNNQISSTKQDVDEANQALLAANARLQDSKQRLTAAQDALAKANADLADAQLKDKAAAEALAAAEVALAEAKEAVTVGFQRLKEQQARVGTMARQQYQQSSPLLGLAVIVSGTTPAEFSERLQWVTTMNSAAQAQIDRLAQEQRDLQAAKDHQAQVEAEVSSARTTAAKQLKVTEGLRARAASAASAVADLVKLNTENQAAAAKLLAEEKKRLAALEAEQRAVNARIAARLAAAKKKYGAIVGGFARPVDGPVTSLYGMRFHPVLLVWKLHDGQDYGAACGAPIRAAAAGTVTERYYNAGYGNRLMIDHGYKNGLFMTTGYNHATHYIVSVGQHVGLGQVIGYVGSTGYSTGCHLHLMVWENGVVVNPAKYFGTT